MKKRYRAIGIMSGSSLDGLDISTTSFWEESGQWKFEIEKAETKPISDELISRLKQSEHLSSKALSELDDLYGKWIAGQLEDYIEGDKLEIDCVALHGHTVYHEPAQGYSLQIGSGREVANATGILTIDDFRNDDIKKGGQGAPLVPVGEYNLFPEYAGFINLGGISNITTINAGKIRAWDICPFNQVFNYYARLLGEKYDAGGQLAMSGNMDQKYYDGLVGLPYFKSEPPKSLSNQWGVENGLYVDRPARDVLHTYANVAAKLIAEAIKKNLPQGAKVLFTGGGAFNTYAMDLVRQNLAGSQEVVIPSKEIVEFKESLIFGFLGLLRLLERPNVFASATGASADSVAGQLHLPSA
ncbi:MAG: anhydro-N-acetylmuramic acid kinase [Cyclobacteriaceae bacterium]